jgi:hypothetical protein
MKKFWKYVLISAVVLLVALCVLIVLSTMAPADWKLTPDILVIIAGAVLSISLSKVKAWNEEFAGLPSEQKVWINIGLCVLMAVLIFLGTCTGWFVIPGIMCTVKGAESLILIIFFAAGGNQLAYLATPESDAVKAAKASRSL